jgi:hypothetical protein
MPFTNALMPFKFPLQPPVKDTDSITPSFTSMSIAEEQVPFV